MRSEQLLQLICIVEEKSISKAAIKLHIAQSTLSISMKNLEKELGVEIFRKQGRHITLTPMGEEIYRRVMVICQELTELKNITEKIKEEKHILSVANAFSLLGNDTIIDIYNCNKKNIVNLKLEDCAIGRIIENVTRGISELGVVRFPKYKEEVFRRILDLNSLVYEKLALENVCVVVGKANPLYYIDSDKIDIEHIKKFKYVTHLTESMDMIWTSFLNDLNITDIKMSLASLGGVMETIRKTDLAFIDTRKDHTHQEWYNDIRYIEISPPIECELGYIKLKGTNLSDIGKLYIEQIKKRIKNWNEAKQ